MNQCIRRDSARWTTCRCSPECIRQQARVKKLHDAGLLPPSQSAAAYEVVREWLHQGYTASWIATACGLSVPYVSNLAARVRKGERVQIGYVNARRILTGNISAATTGVGPSVGWSRRLQALTWLGYSLATLSELTGVPQMTLSCIREGKRRVGADKAAAIREAWDRIGLQIGPDPQAAARARSRGWHGPLAWDDDTIDDPAVGPNLGEATARRYGGDGRPSADVADDVQWLLDEIAPRATAQQMAERLGYRDANPLYVSLRRAGRDDLRDRLAKNSADAKAREFSPPPRRPKRDGAAA